MASQTRNRTNADNPLEILLDESILQAALDSVERHLGSGASRNGESALGDPTETAFHGEAEAATEEEPSPEGPGDAFVLVPDGEASSTETPPVLSHAFPTFDARELRIQQLTATVEELESQRSNLEEVLRRSRLRHKELEEELERVHLRAQRDRENAQKFGHDNTLKELLPFVENMERAAAWTGADPARFAQGIQMVLEQLRRSLSRLGMDRVETRRGVPFDPDRHEAVLQVVTSELPHGCVLDEARPGWTLNGRLLKAAQVTVSCAPPPPVPEPLPAAEPPRARRGAKARKPARDVSPQEGTPRRPRGKARKPT